MKTYTRSIQGFNNGFIYKNYEAFLRDEDEICYIPELVSDKEVLTEEEARAVGYTRRQIEALCEPHNIDPEYIFEMIDWQSPEALIDEIVWNSMEE